MIVLIMELFPMGKISEKLIVEKGKDIWIKCFNYYKIVELFQYTYFKIKKEKENNILSF